MFLAVVEVVGRSVEDRAVFRKAGHRNDARMLNLARMMHVATMAKVDVLKAGLSASTNIASVLREIDEHTAFNTKNGHGGISGPNRAGSPLSYP